MVPYPLCFDTRSPRKILLRLFSDRNVVNIQGMLAPIVGCDIGHCLAQPDCLHSILSSQLSPVSRVIVKWRPTHSQHILKYSEQKTMRHKHPGQPALISSHRCPGAQPWVMCEDWKYAEEYVLSLRRSGKNDYNWDKIPAGRMNMWHLAFVGPRLRCLPPSCGHLVTFPHPNTLSHSEVLTTCPHI